MNTILKDNEVIFFNNVKHVVTVRSTVLLTDVIGCDKYADIVDWAIQTSDCGKITNKVTFVGIARLNEADEEDVEKGVKIAEYKMERQFSRFYARLLKIAQNSFKSKYETLTKLVDKTSGIADQCTERIIELAK